MCLFSIEPHFKKNSVVLLYLALAGTFTLSCFVHLFIEKQGQTVHRSEVIDKQGTRRTDKSTNRKVYRQSDKQAYRQEKDR